MAIKDPQLHEELSDDDGKAKGRKLIARKNGHASRYDNWTVFDLKLRAKELGLQGYSDKSRAQLIDMVRHH